MKKLLPTVTIGIPSYLSSESTFRLTSALLLQKPRNCKIEKIVVISDASTDDTVKKLKVLRDTKLEIIDSKIRNGFAYAVKYLLQKYKSDFVIILNDDIIIYDRFFTDKLLSPFLINKNIGMIGGRIMPVAPTNFIESVQHLNLQVMRRVHKANPNPNHIFTANGKVLALSRKFINSINFPKDLSLMGNVDGYLYLSCVTSKWKYIFNSEGTVYFKFASTLADWIRWNDRNQLMTPTLRKSFGSLADKSFKIYKKYYTCFTLADLVLRFPQFITLIAFHFYVVLKKRTYKFSFDPKWSVVTSTINFKSYAK